MCVVTNVTWQGSVAPRLCRPMLTTASPPGERHPEQTAVSNRYADENASDTPMILNCRYHVYRIIVTCDISLKLDVFGYISVAEFLRLSLTILRNVSREPPSSVKYGKIWAISPFKVIQSHRFQY